MDRAILQQPATIFLTIMAIILIAPLLSKRVRLPGIVGLILGGMIVGEHVANLLSTGPITDLFGSVGLIYLMFNAGLDIDLGQFQRVRNRAIAFAAMSFVLPEASGIGIGRWLGLSWAGAVLLGATYASQTLVAYPLLGRLGIIKNNAVAIGVGATIFTDITALLILAVINSTGNNSVSLISLGKLIGYMVGYSLLILLGVPWLGKLVFQKVGGNAVQFQFVLVVLFVAAVLAEQIGMSTIVGAFMAGLAINATLSQHTKVVGQIHFLGDSLFIPLFLVTVGMRLNPVELYNHPQGLIAGGAMLGAVYVTKFAAAWLAGRAFKFTWPEIMTLWGLSQAQAAATLATALIARNDNLFSDPIFNGTILMVLFTTVTSPILVRRFGNRVTPDLDENAKKQPSFERVLVPILDIEAPRFVLDLAAVLAHSNEGAMLPLIVATDDEVVKQSAERLQNEELTYPETDVQMLKRIETSVAEGIRREANEQDATLIVAHLHGDPSGKEGLFGPIWSTILWDAGIPVLLVRMSLSANAVERVVLVVASQTVGVKLDDDAVTFVEGLARALNVPLQVLATAHYVDRLEARFLDPNTEDTVIRLGEDAVQEIVDHVQERDLVVVTTMGSRKRFQRNTGIPEQLFEKVPGAIAVLNYP